MKSVIQFKVHWFILYTTWTAYKYNTIKQPLFLYYDLTMYNFSILKKEWKIKTEIYEKNNNNTIQSINEIEISVFTMHSMR